MNLWWVEGSWYFWKMLKNKQIFSFNFAKYGPICEKTDPQRLVPKNLQDFTPNS